METRSKSKTIRIIESLLARSDPARNPYPGERRLAKEKAQKLADSIGISLDSISPEGKVEGAPVPSQDSSARGNGDHASPVCCPIAGFQYYDGPSILADLRMGDTIFARGEPGNPHDSNAVALYWNGRKLGYVPRAMNKLFIASIRQGKAIIGHVSGIDASHIGWGSVHVEFSVRDF